MNRWALGVGGLALVFAAAFAVIKGNQGGSEVEYRYSAVTRGDIMRSTSAVGVLTPLTRVDVKSKAGGRVVKLFVQEGSVVKKGDKLALIDPSDTEAIYQQAEADVRTAQAKVGQAQTNARMEAQSAEQRVRDAEIALATARTRLARTEQTAQAQPTLSQADVKTAQANLEASNEALRSLREIQVPQMRRDAEGQYQKAKADLDTANAEMTRLTRLLGQGYVSQSDVDRQRAAVAASQATYRVAEQRRATIETEIESDVKTAQAKVHQGEQQLAQARANLNRVPISARDLEEARQNVKAAQVALEEARTARLNVRLRQEDVASAQAGAVRSRVAMDNAKIQLESTTVVAPRDGVVTTKYLEEGTIIPPGTSTFAQGTSLVQIADTTQMEVECSVDEADIGSVREGQDVNIVLEAYPGVVYDGVVKRIFPSADTSQSVTTVKVRVGVNGINREKSSFARRGGAQSSGGASRGFGQGQGRTGAGGSGGTGGQVGGRRRQRPILRPGMNATCEFVQFSKADVLQVPQQAIQREGDKTYVRVKSADPKKPERREVVVGATGNDTIEVVSGLKEGEEVVVAEIDLAAMRDRQARMQQIQQGNTGLGGLQRGGPSQSRASSGGGGGNRAGGGGR